MLGICLTIAPLLLAADPAATIDFTPGVTLQLATLEQGREAIARADDFTRALSKLDVQIRLRTDAEVTADDYIKFVTPHVTEWKEEEREKMARVAGRLRDRLAKLEVAPPWPAKVLVVRTTGLEEAQAAYTRGAAIFLPANKVTGSEAVLEKFLAHELFHVLTRNAPRLRERLYALIGFHPCPAVELPGDWRDRKLTNPDAPALDTAIDLELDDKTVKGVPFLYARDAKYRPQPGDSLFRYLEFRLMVVEIQDGKARPRLVDGQPLFIDPRNAPSFHKQIGQNTGYIIHPDEVLADNFMHLALGTTGLKTPELLERLKAELAEENAR